MSQEILINHTPGEVRIALVDKGQLQEIHIERKRHASLVGNFYKGQVSRLIPGIQAAFIDIGLDRSAFLHVSDLGVDDALQNTDVKNQHIDIRKLLTVGQSLLVQVYKDPLSSKGARLTTQYTVPSRYLVLTPKSPVVSVSQKIADEAERERLLSLVSPGSQGGYIFRTSSIAVKAEELAHDQAYLEKLWRDITAKSMAVLKPGLVYQEMPLELRVLRDWEERGVERIWIDDQALAETMQTYIENFVPIWQGRIQFYHDTPSLFNMYSIESELHKALQRKVSLKSGGYLIIDQTEAMTTVDVNTGSYLGHHQVEDAIFNTNIEAAHAIARQLRLRNLGGIIIIDFIDMPHLPHQQSLMIALQNVLAKDSAKVQISELSSLGLVQLTRKRTRESLEHILCVPCPLCAKRGSVQSAETMTYEILREITKLAKTMSWPGFEVVASPSVAAYLSHPESLLPEVSALVNKPITIKSEISYAQEQYAVLPLSNEATV